MQDWERLYASRMGRVVASDVRELAALMRQPGMISFGGGVPDPTLFPTQSVAEAASRILGDPARARVALQYSDSAGYLPLREWLATDFTANGVPCTADNILITAGSQQGLDLICRLFVSAGDRIATERPTYIGALRAFDACEPRYGSLPWDRGEGEVGGAVKFAYVMPDFQNPMGTCLDLQQRSTLLDEAEAHGFAIVEDAAYTRLRFEGEDLPSLLALEAARAGGIDAGRVLLTTTISKTVVPALRVGWVVGPRPLIRKLVLLKQAVDLHTSTLNQMLMLELVGELAEERVAVVRAGYRRRRDATLAALERHMPDDVSWTRPEGGLYVWIVLPQGMDGSQLAQSALRDFKVAVVSGKSFFPDRPAANTVRLSYSQVPEDRIEEGARRLAAAIAALRPGAN